jgi:phage gpG-like protein
MATNDRAAIDIRFKNLEQIRASIDKKKVALQHRGNVFHQSTIILDRWVQKNFQSEGQMAYSGQGWKPLAESTKAGRLGQRRVKEAAKAKGKPVKTATIKILQQSGWLRNRWKHFWNDKYAIIQSGVDYGIYHDSDAPRKKLPQRKITPTEKQIMPELLKLFGKFIKTSLSKR